MGAKFSFVDEPKAGPVDENVNEKGASGEKKEIHEITKEIQAVTLEDIHLEEVSGDKKIVEYCLALLHIRFCGQTSVDGGETDHAVEKDVLNLGLYLSLLDKFVRKYEVVTDLTGTEEEFLSLLRLIATKRRREGEDLEICYKRLVDDSKRFVKIFHKRGEHSTALKHNDYWGCRQQMLSAKVISDWVDEENGPLDPVYGVLLQPTTGRVGPGDTGLLHDLLFDDTGHMAYHSAVHDAFGYLINFHHIGPGYNYMKHSCFTSENPMAGQLSGIDFWKKVVSIIQTKGKSIAHVSL